MAVLSRQESFTPVRAALINEHATEIERLAMGLFASLTNTARPRFLVARTSTLSVNNVTDIDVPWQTATIDPLGMWDPGSPSNVTCMDSGTWLFLAQERWPLSAAGSRAGKVRKNGALMSSSKLPAQNDGEGTTVGFMALFTSDVGDLFSLNAWQSSGVAQSLQVDFGGTFFGGIWMGPA